MKNKIYQVLFALMFVIGAVVPAGAVGVISGYLSICSGNTTVLADTSSGGRWSSNATGIATVDSLSGTVTGHTAGTATITYKVSSTNYATAVIAVSAIPAAITGSSVVCIGSAVSLTETTSGGTWSSASESTASVDGSGNVSGVNTGATTISYTIADGCFSSKTISVNPTPAPISGVTPFCASTSVTFTDATEGGVWSSSAIATSVGSASGIVNGLVPGGSVISYSIGGCAATMAVTVNQTPGAILDGYTTDYLCTGVPNQLTVIYATGGTWVSSNTAVGSVNSTTGMSIGINAGTTMITYTAPDGCISTQLMTAYTNPGAISGVSCLNYSSSYTFSDPSEGGVWLSSTIAAHAGSLTGVVTGVLGGTSIISYVMPSGCLSTFGVHVGTSTLAISGGTTTLCAGSSTSLSDITSGGTWVSSNTEVATIGTTGLLSAIAAGSSIISYSIPSGCYSYTTIGVISGPSPISGTPTICSGSTYTFTDPTDGGVWSSSTSAASVGTSTGIVTGVLGGVSTISYKLSGCSATMSVTIALQPTPISAGSSVICAGTTTSFGDGVYDGSWSSSNTTVASFGTTASTLSGLSAGTTTITYLTPSGCYASILETVLSTPSAGSISGTMSVCASSTTSLTETIPGGTWYSSATTVATVNSSGVVSGVSGGTALISYKVSNTCGTAYTSGAVTVSPLPTTGTITGANTVNVGSMVSLTDTTGGGSGAWTSSNTSFATVASGVVSGVATGVVYISYTLTNSCGAASAVKSITVLPNAGTISGNTNICAGTSTTLSESVSGGRWASLSTAIATIGSATGVLTGVNAGVTTITYFITGSYATATVTVNASPAAISGVSTICNGSATTLADATGGGTWSSTSTGVASISSGGVITTVSAGTTIISYSLSDNCAATKQFAVNALPGAITGSGTMCSGTTATFTDGTSGGTWSSSSIAASVNASTGLVSANLGGLATIMYSISGCSASYPLSIVNSPAAVSGAATACVGSTVNYSDGTSGGAWSSGNSSVASVGTNGMVTGVAAGTAAISYTVGGSCSSSGVISVFITPGAISGSTPICIGQPKTFTDGTSEGVWSSSTSGITVGSASGIVNGTLSGNATISYSLGGCTATYQVTANVSPNAITVIQGLCTNNVTNYSEETGGGTWSTSNTAIATINASTGNAVGVAAGTVIISYTLSDGCSSAYSVSVNASPGVINGVPAVACVGSTYTFTNDSAGGWWSSSSICVLVGTTTGIINAVLAGGSSITYNNVSFCRSITTFTVANVPNSISGPSSVCGAPATFTDASSGGIWYSSNTEVATIGSLTGVVNGISAGTSLISYSTGGCSALKLLTVNSSPGGITGQPSMCTGYPYTLSNPVSGGTWSSTNTSVASINSSSGIVTTVGAGTAIISYSLNSGCVATLGVTVSTSPSAISGPSAICNGSNGTFTDASPTGAWTSNNTSVVTINSGTGIATGVGAGTAIISYTNSVCFSIATVTVNTAPAAITGNALICTGGSISLSESVSGGVWSSTSTSVATVSGGEVSSVAAGTAVISYTIANCAASVPVTVNTTPAVVSGVAAFCNGASSTYTDATGSGVWSSTNTGVATVNSSSGLASSVAAGTTTLSYTLSGCSNSKVITVNPLPAAIGGTPVVCAGQTSTLTDATTPGTWSSSNNAVGTIGSVTGTYGGVAAGTETITYTITATGCATTTMASVNPLPSSITGTTSVCAGANITLADVTEGGAWSSNNTAVGTIDASAGTVGGITAGTTVITFSISATGCYKTTVVTVNALPNAISGASAICAGSTTTLTDAGSGTWSSANTAVGTIGSSTGTLGGVASGSTTITYTLNVTGCYTTTQFTVNPLPASIGGTTSVCAGSTTTLTDGTGGGTWSSSNTAAGTIDASAGTVGGIAAGTTTVTFTISATGCYKTTLVTVNPLPNAITGASAICAGSTTTLSDAGSGTWSSSTTAVGTVGSGTGTVGGVAAGTTTITYTLTATGCYNTTAFTVNALPNTIGGTAAVCAGSTTTLTDGTGGGTWSSSNTAAGTIDASAGTVGGIASGTTTITYTISATGCYKTTLFTVNPIPNAISGSSAVCVGATTTLSDAGSGTWSSSNIATGTIDPSSGIIGGVAAGTTTVTYTLNVTGCYNTTVFTVNPLPSSISGANAVCVSSTTTLTDAGSGTWSSSNSAVGTIGSGTGTAGGVAAGTATITYKLNVTGCYTTESFTVNALPSSISGASAVCVGANTTLTDAGSGTWSSSMTAVGTIDAAAGIVGGITSGTTTITYTLNVTGCYKTTNITVNPLPGAISGSSAVCVGSTTTLTDAGSGTWSSANTAVGTIGSSTGTIGGVASGSTTITYTLNVTSCYTTTQFTVNPLPNAISGASSECVGATTTLTDAGSGTWSSSNVAIGSVDAMGGAITGVAAGTTNITYTLNGSGCYITTVFTINPIPNAISGASAICQNATTTLTDAGSGTWSSSNTAIGTIGSGTGTIGGVAAGTTTVTYTLNVTGCYNTSVFTVNPLPNAITGSSAICANATTTLTDAGSGTWSSSTTAVGTIGGSTGTIGGVSAGTTTVTYTLNVTGCYNTSVITVNPLPSAISGASAVCVGATTTLTDGGSGTWSSSNTAAGTIGSGTGTVGGVTAGSTTITYTLNVTGCYNTDAITINPLPNAIAGTNAVCAGMTTTLTDGTGSGTWSSSNTAVGTVGAATGTVGGVAAGTGTISYTITATGCYSTVPFTVNPVPSAITGTQTLCSNLTSTLTDGGTGTWSSSNTSVGTIDPASGIFAGVSGGTTIVTYTLTSTGCYTTIGMSVNQNPASITGLAGACVAGTSTLSDATSGGTWSSSNTSVATIDVSAGTLSGVAIGSATVTYAITTGGCYTTEQVYITTQPAAISGASVVCTSTTTTLTDGTSGGNWSSSATAVGTVGTASGIVGGVSAGTTTITYGVGGCFVTSLIAVSQQPAAIATGGVTTMCSAIPTTYTDGTSGGAWSSSNTSVVTVDASLGSVDGVASGTATISYTINSTCSAISQVTINSAPAAIVGPFVVCSTTDSPSPYQYTDAVSGGSWSETSPGGATVATINASTGVVTSAVAGTCIISYSIGSGASTCYAVKTLSVTVISGPAAISSFTVCTGYPSVAFTDVTTGGTWSSTSNALTNSGTTATNSTTVTGLTNGTATVSYATNGGGCISIVTVSVNQSPSAIFGQPWICGTATFTDTTSGGTWSKLSSSTAATVGATTGVVTASVGGVVTITYSLPSGCVAAYSTSVTQTTSGYVASANLCQGTISESDPYVFSGTWYSSNSAVVATTGSTGVGKTTGTGTGAGGVFMDAVSLGTAMITYITASSGCSVTTFTVNASPDAITGPKSSVAISGTLDLSDLTSSGTWSSSSTLRATVNSSGVVTGVGTGTDMISYSISDGCSALYQVSVCGTCRATDIASLNLCIGYNLQLQGLGNAVGTWKSSNPDIAAVDPYSGIASGMSQGVATISFILSGDNQVGALVYINVQALPEGVSIATDPGTTVQAGTPVSFGAKVQNGVSSVYQWLVNGEAVQGATEQVFTTNTLSNNDNVSVVVGSANGCGDYTVTASEIVNVISNASSGNMDLKILPNPNNGTFVIKGSVGVNTDEDVSLIVRDMIGQVVYTGKITATMGNVNQNVKLNGNLANGMYILTVTSGSVKDEFHFVIEQ